MKFGGGDGGLMYCRAFLESFWAEQLSDSERAQWVGHWLSDPPTDGRGRSYILDDRTNLQQTVRPAQTLYAWAVMPAVYYLGRDPRRTPPNTPEPVTSWSIVNSTPPTLTLQISTTAEKSPDYGQTFYAAKWQRITRAPKISELKYIGAASNLADGATRNIFAWLNNLTPIAPDQIWTIAVRSVGTGRGAIAQLPLLQLTILPP